MSKFLEKHSALVLRHANDLNYFGKRLKDKRLEVAEQVITELVTEDLPKAEKLEPAMLVKWLDENKPAKAEKERTKTAKIDTKLPANTMIGNASKRTLPVLDSSASRFIVVGAQNNTHVKKDFFNKLKELADEVGAGLIVLPIHYNKKAFSGAVADETEYYDQAVKPFLVDSDQWLFAPLAVRVAPSARVLPTVKYPVNKAASQNEGELFTIVPSPKQQLRTLTRMLNQPVRQAWTTGCCTVFNYTESAVGAEAEKDHVFGALLVSRLSDGSIHCTNLREGFNGEIQAIYPSAPDSWTATESIDGNDRPAIKLGDLHCEMYCPETWTATLNLLEQIDPVLIAADDIIHFSTMSHHNRNNATHLYRTKEQTVFGDLLQVITQLNELAPLTDVVYITESNHNSAVDVWIADQGFRPESSPQNAKLFYLLKWLLCEAIDNGEELPAYELALKSSDLSGLPAMAENIIFGRMDKPYIVNGYDFSQHGHKGDSGSRGSHIGISRYGLSLVTGHTHSAAITGRLFTTGVTASYDQGYNRGGGSNWCHSHVIAWPSGECQMINLDNQGV